jgi:HD-like signal output (HDOD) protein
MANSPYYGLSGRVSNATTAVTVLGFTTVGSLAAAAVARLNDRSQLPEGFWDQAMRVAVAAGLVARSFSVQPADAFCAGVLMDVGSALLFQADPKGYDAVAAVPHRGTAVLEVEQQRYGMTHADVAQRILGAWRFPHPMCGAIGRHHDHLASGCDALSRVLALAQLLADTSAIGALDDAEVSMLSDGRMTASYAATLLPRIEAEAVALAEAMTT